MANTGQEGEEEEGANSGKAIRASLQGERERHFACRRLQPTTILHHHCQSKPISKGTHNRLLLIVSSSFEISILLFGRYLSAMSLEFTRDHLRPESRPAKPIAVEV